MKKKIEYDMLTITEVSEMLHIHPNTLRNWDIKGKLKAIRIDSKGTRRYRRSDVDAFIEELAKVSPEDFKRKPKSR